MNRTPLDETKNSTTEIAQKDSSAIVLPKRAVIPSTLNIFSQGFVTDLFFHPLCFGQADFLFLKKKCF